MIKEKNKIKNIVLLGTILLIFSICVIGVNKNQDATIQTTSKSFDTKIMEWGMERGKDNQQPDFGTENRKILEENEGICVGNSTDKFIYLTFDEGYEAGYTESILNILQQNNVKATFFITSHYLNTASTLVERMINEGHIIGNHTCNHPNMPTISDETIEEEIMKLHQAVYEKFNYEMKYFRPPQGKFNERTLKKTSELGYKTVMWSFAYSDWNEKKQPSIEEAKDKIISNFHCGEIMLLHPNSKTNAEVLDTIIKEAKNQGYEFKSLDEFN